MTYEDQSKTYDTQAMLKQGEGNVFKGAPNIGVPAGPTTSPQYREALNQG